MKKVSLGVLVSVLGFCAQARAGVIHYVSPSGSGGGSCASPDFNRVQDAIDASGGGDTVVVCAGLYAESLAIVNKNASAGSDVDQILIRAATPYGEAATAEDRSIIAPQAGSGDDSSAAFAVSIRRSKYVAFSGFEIRSGGAGSVYVSPGGKRTDHLLLEGNDIRGSAESDEDSHGVVIDAGNGQVTVRGNLIREHGGFGAWMKTSPDRPAFESGALVIDNIFVENNEGGLRVDNRPCELIRNLIVRNGGGANGRGWGLLAKAPNAEQITLAANLFDSNGATYARGKWIRRDGDLRDVRRILDATDADNYTTTGTEGPDADGANPATGVACCTNGDVVFVGQVMLNLGYGAERTAEGLRVAYGADVNTVLAALRAAGTSLEEIVEVLAASFGVGAADLAELLIGTGDYSLAEIAAALASVLGSTGSELIEIFLELGQSAADVAQVLVDVFGATALELATAFLDARVPLEQIIGALRDALQLADAEIAGALLAAGVDAEDIEPLIPGIVTAQAGDETYIPNLCGDAWCDAPKETHATCPQDCFAECYGSGALCSRRYDEVLVAGTHNANVSLAYFLNFPFFNINQSRTLTQQLDDGIRHLELDIDYCTPNEEGGDVCLCHNNDFCPAGSLPAAAGLGEIYNWLVANPSEVVTLNFEEYLDGEDFDRVMIDSGLASMAFETPGRRCTVSKAACSSREECPEGEMCKVEDYWPYSLNNMAKRNRRVVVFNVNYSGSSDWVLSSSLIEKTPFGIDLDDEWPCSDSPPDPEVRYGLEHVRSGLFGIGDVAASACANATTNIENHLEKCESAAGRNVNFVIVDFYETSRGPLEIVNIANGVTAIDDLFPAAGCDCHTSEDCSSSDFCLATFCTPRLPNGAGPCFTNDMCVSDICNFGFCIGEPQPGGTPCTTDAACISGDCDGICRTRCGDGACEPPEETCYSASCQDDCGGCPNGTPCTLNADCNSGICNFGFCIDAPLPGSTPCTTDAACISGDCDVVCQTVCGDGRCEFPETCYDASCQEDCGACPNGTPCTRDADCASDDCFAGFCIQPNVCGNGRCEFPETCYDDSCQDDCGACPNGTPCTRNDDCDSGFCVGVCADRP